ncbi:hypothetical protein V1527DRAFT_446184 [Lipomyces starkeyi]
MGTISDRKGHGSATDDRLSSRNVTQQNTFSSRRRKTTKRSSGIAILPHGKRSTVRKSTLMEHTELLDMVRRPLSPDTQLEVTATRDEYDRVQEILEEEGAKYPQLLYDSSRNTAIVVAAPSPLHSGMANELMVNIRDAVVQNQAIDAAMVGGICTMSDTTTTRGTGHGNTTRAWDTALGYIENDDNTLMIAIEVGVSQAYESLQAAISWSVCALHCRVGVAMSITEGSRGKLPRTKYYNSDQDADVAIEEIKRDLRHQLTQCPYGPLVKDGVAWFGRVGNVVLETFRYPDENCARETVLRPTQSFTLVRRGEYVRGNIPPDLHEVVMGDCIPTHILSNGQIESTPVNFFRRDWFESKFRALMLQTALERVYSKTVVLLPE